ncbi:MAG: hypothetical protein PVG03_06020 [Desulfarculaceae bacterium]|jgi:hypothetical protein
MPCLPEELPGSSTIPENPHFPAEVILRLNTEMDLQAQLGQVDESSLEKIMNRLLQGKGVRTNLYWLTLARLMELALWGAGAYADAGEFSAAGDLLLNPRQKALYQQGRLEPYPLKRHQSLTKQAEPWANEDKNIRAWLKQKTTLAVQRQAILPALREKLESSSVLGQEYLASVDERMGRIASTLVMINALHLPSGTSLPDHLKTLPASERRFIEVRLCSFDLSCFRSLGDKIKNAIAAEDSRLCYQV